MITTEGKVYEQRGVVYVKTSRPAVDNLADDVTIVWRDDRAISAEQRRKAWALVGEICVWAGYMAREKEDVNAHLKQRFLMQQVEEYQRQMFSLSDCTMSQAREYITFLIDFCLMNDVPTSQPLSEYADDLKAYTYTALIHRKCIICGKHADIHHMEGSMIGMGGNRYNVSHVGRELLPLCREHHTLYHNIGDKRFKEQFHVEPVVADEALCKKLGLNTKTKKERAKT